MNISYKYKKLNDREKKYAFNILKNSWQSKHLPAKQWQVVDIKIQQYKNESAVAVFDVLVEGLQALPDIKRIKNVLEIGCSSGYYSEVFKLANLNFQYEGCDYSDHFIAFAKEKYPLQTFKVSDATDLAYPGSSFDIVISGCCLLHIENYEKAIQEAARVSKKYVIFHRTPIIFNKKTFVYIKKAYGIDTFEIHFNENDFINLIIKNDMSVIATYTIDDNASLGAEANRTYFCKKNT